MTTRKRIVDGVVDLSDLDGLEQDAKIIACNREPLVSGGAMVILGLIKEIRRLQRESTLPRCECPVKASHHEAGECSGEPIGLYRRDDREMWLCEKCDWPHDVRLAAPPPWPRREGLIDWDGWLDYLPPPEVAPGPSSSLAEVLGLLYEYDFYRTGVNPVVLDLFPESHGGSSTGADPSGRARSRS